MAKSFRPFTYLDGHKYVEFSTYRDFKKEIKTLLQNNCNDITVFRHRRGEWGEWFERWQIRGNKAIIAKQGWC